MGNKENYEDAKRGLREAEAAQQVAQGGSSEGGLEAARQNFFAAREELREARAAYQEDPNG